MIEILEHEAYKLLKENYNKSPLDYVIISVNEEYEGLETHKKAIIEAFKILNKRNNSENKYIINEEKMMAKVISIEEFLQLPIDDYYNDRKKFKVRSFSAPEPMTYWFAFLQPPHNVPYLKSDFIFLNKVLFPNEDSCEVYCWNDEFSNYFEEGKEWWGTGLWTIYDRITGIIIIIGASLTD